MERTGRIFLGSPGVNSASCALTAAGCPTFTEGMARPPVPSDLRTVQGGVYAFLSALSANRRKVATVGAAVLAVSVAYHVAFGPNGVTVYLQKRHETLALETEVKRLQQENDGLKGHVSRLQSDPGAIEHEAREQLHYARPGEVIYRLESHPPAVAGAAGQAAANATK